MGHHDLFDVLASVVIPLLAAIASTAVAVAAWTVARQSLRLSRDATTAEAARAARQDRLEYAAVLRDVLRATRDAVSIKHAEWNETVETADSWSATVDQPGSRDLFGLVERNCSSAWDVVATSDTSKMIYADQLLTTASLAIRRWVQDPTREAAWLDEVRTRSGGAWERSDRS